MEIRPVAYFRSPLSEKFGIPRQSGLAASLKGKIVFEPEFRNPDALRGLDGFSRIWLVWEFSANRHGAPGASWQALVRPPRLGGNKSVGVFASRSPYRPNPLGLSCVEVESVVLSSAEGHVINVKGADLMDGTPIYDIKPYVTYADSFPDAHSGFVDEEQWKPLQVVLPEELLAELEKKHVQVDALVEVLAQDPRPQYQHDPERGYGMAFGGVNIRFRVDDASGTLEVIGI